MRPGYLILVLAIILCIPARPGYCDDKQTNLMGTIAGVLEPGYQEYSDYTFSSSGSTTLFANLDGQMYQTMSPEGASPQASSGGCAGEDEPGTFYLEVIGPNGVVCHVGRPIPPPGWLLDPRMACNLPATQGKVTYTLRVGLNESEGSLPQPAYSFLLNVSLRAIAPTGMDLEQAIVQSQNRF